MDQNDSLLSEDQIEEIKSALLSNMTQAIEEDIEPIENRILQLAKAVAQIPKDSSISIQSAYTRAFALLHYVDYYIGAYPRQVAYVTNTGDVYTAPLIEMANHIDNNYRIVGGARGMEKLLTHEMQELLSQEHLEKVKAAFIGTNNRLQRFYSRMKSTGVYSTRQGGFLLYKNQAGEWIGQRILNFGDVKEAYLAAMLDRKNNQNSFKKLPIGTDQYKSHELISYFAQKYLYAVDSKSSVGGEDVISKILSAQFAVKGEKAAAPALQQYVSFAEAIINKNPKQKLKNMLKQYIQAEKKQPAGLRNLILKETYKTREDIENMIEQTLLSGQNFSFK